jgi:hypothetical protein
MPAFAPPLREAEGADTGVVIVKDVERPVKDSSTLVVVDGLVIAGALVVVADVEIVEAELDDVNVEMVLVGARVSATRLLIIN